MYTISIGKATDRGEDEGIPTAAMFPLRPLRPDDCQQVIAVYEDAVISQAVKPLQPGTDPGLGTTRRRGNDALAVCIATRPWDW